MCRKLIDDDLLDRSQKDWINNYHTQCRKRLIAECKKQECYDLIEWIKNNTKPI